MDRYRFKKASLEELPLILSLIRARIAWMKEKGIDQWDEHYLTYYNENYFRQAVRDGAFYLLWEGDEAVGTIALFPEDGLWPGCENGYYLHHLSTAPGHPGLGREILSRCEELARQEGKVALRLDCQSTNAQLNDYYQSLGYHYVETVNEENYEGNKREKQLLE